jgi:uncharacterized lipoprotein YmbA
VRARGPGLSLLAAALAAVAPACVSLKRTPEARFFVLRSLAEPRAPDPASAHGPAADLVGLLPVLVPEYLDRPQVVTSSAAGELRIDEFRRWAEPLDAGISRTLAENLDVLLPRVRLVRWPWAVSTPLRCRVRVEVAQFGPEAGGGPRLQGAFVVLPPRGERSLARRPFDLRRPPRSADVAGTVEDMSALVLDLSREIEAVLAALPGEGDARSAAPAP